MESITILSIVRVVATEFRRLLYSVPRQNTTAKTLDGSCRRTFPSVSKVARCRRFSAASQYDSSTITGTFVYLFFLHKDQRDFHEQRITTLVRNRKRRIYNISRSHNTVTTVITCPIVLFKNPRRFVLDIRATETVIYGLQISRYPSTTQKAAYDNGYCPF